MPWYIYLAFKWLFPTGRRMPFFFIVSMLGVMIGVWILVVVQSVMGGFGQIYRQKIIETNGHLRIESSTAMYDFQATLDYLDNLDGVAAAAPYVHGFVMLQYRNRPAFPVIRGIDIEREPDVIPIREFTWLGSIDDLDDDSVMLSRSLASSLGVILNSTVEVYTPFMLEKLKDDEVLLPRELKVVGIYETGWNDFDSSTMVSTLRLMQELYNLEGGVHGVSVRVHPGIDEADLAGEIAEHLEPGYRVMTWLEMYADWLWVLQLEKNFMFIILIPIVIVAAFAIGIAQLLITIRKTREIGLIEALGGQSKHLVACFCIQGFAIGVAGCVFGILLALVFLHYRNDFVYLFASLTGSQDILIKFYQFADLPVKYAASDFVIIVVSAIALTTVASLIPAWRAVRLKPAEALRNE